MFEARHSSDVLVQLQRLGPDEQDDYLIRLVPAVTRDPLSNTALFGRTGLAYRIARFGRGRFVLIRIDYPEQRVWFVRILDPEEVHDVGASTE